jgi:DNA-binding transcriptional ArsR family regulator
MLYRMSELPRIRDLTDPRAMRALAHPVRIALLDALTEAGALTATQAAEHVGESPSSCSFHLRQLAKYGFVEPAEGGRGRERPWRRAHEGLTFTDQHEGADAAMAAGALDRALRARRDARLDAARAARPLLPPAWQAVTGESQFLVRVTPDELRELDETMTGLLRRFTARPDPPAGAEPVEVLLAAHRVAG